MSRLRGLLRESRPLVMGILNTTPDSFHDGGAWLRLPDAVGRASDMISEGVDIIDVGGESTRPGAVPVDGHEEMSRVIPVIAEIRKMSDVAISVDTSTPEVIEAAARHDIDLVNDVRALRRPGALEAVAGTELPVCLMHMKGEPRTMQARPHYEDLMGEIRAFFRERISACVAGGISRNRLLLDPGFGFGKTPAHNLKIINRLPELAVEDLPLLVGLSRKSTIAGITDNPLIGSVAGALVAIERGARIVRVHDVAETVSALRVVTAISRERVDTPV